MDSVYASLLLGAAQNTAKARSLAEKGLLEAAAYHAYVALQLRSAALLRVADPGKEHICSVYAILRLAVKGLQRRGLAELAEELERIIEENKDTIHRAEKIHSLAMYKRLDVDREDVERILALVSLIDGFEDRVRRRLAEEASAP